MITPIVAGMTPVEYISAINANLSGVLLEAYTPVTQVMTTIELQNTLNTNLSKSDVLVGVSGVSYLSTINSNFTDYGFAGNTPTLITATAVEDFIRISFTDGSGGLAQHEILQSKDGAAFELLTTLDAGVSSYDYECTLILGYKFRVRSKRGAVYSTYTTVVNFGAFWPFRTNQTELTTISFHQIRLDDDIESSVNINWGDGSDEDYSPIGNVYDEVEHDYTETGIYWIHITGDIAKIITLQFFSQALNGTDVTRWKLPNTAFFCHLYGNGFIGDFSSIQFPAAIGGIHFGGNNDITGNADTLFGIEHPNWWDCHLPVGGNGATWTISAKLAHIYIDDGLYGDISHWVFPKNNDYQSWAISLRGAPTGNITNLFDGTYQYLHTIELIGFGLTGDLSGWDIGADYSVAASIELGANSFTKLPRGNFYKFGVYDCNANSCNQAEIDSVLADIETSVGVDAPEYDCAYTLNGAGMGIPSAAGLTSKTNIETAYTNAGKTATILVNS